MNDASLAAYMAMVAKAKTEGKELIITKSRRAGSTMGMNQMKKLWLQEQEEEYNKTLEQEKHPRRKLKTS